MSHLKVPMNKKEISRNFYIEQYSTQEPTLLMIHVILKFSAWIILLRNSKKQQEKNCTSLLWNGSMATEQRSICVNSSTEFTIKNHKSFFIILSMFLISLELPKKLHDGTVLKWICSPYTEQTWLRWVILIYKRKSVIRS